MVELQESKVVTLENEGIFIKSQQIIYNPISNVATLVREDWVRFYYHVTKVKIKGDESFLWYYEGEFLYIVKKNRTPFGCVLENTELGFL